MEKLIAKYTAKLKEVTDLIKRTGNSNQREFLFQRAAHYREFLADLEAKHKSCSCRNLSTHDDTRRNSPSLHDRELFFKED